MDKLNGNGSGQNVLITGASAGIGKELARCFARNGYNLILVARSADKLQALADDLASEYKIEVYIEPADLLQANAAEQLFTSLQQQSTHVDILVNNAGLLEQGDFTDIDLKRHQNIIALNITAPTELLAYFVPPMLKRGRGRIMNVGSTSAFNPVPWLASYAASKAYVLSLTESLSVELKGTGITATAFCPGYTETDMLTDDMKTLPSFMVQDVKSVAQEGYEACTNGEVIRVPGLVNRASIHVSRALPKWLARRLSSTSGRPNSR